MFGMHLFMHVKRRHGLDNTYNFDTFLSAFTTLLPISITNGFADVLSAIIDESNCEVTHDDVPGDCGHHFIGIVYMVSYILICYYIIMNIVVAIVFDCVKRVNDEMKVGITDYTIQMFFNQWQRFDMNASEYIHSLRLNDFLESLQEPFKVTNSEEITAMNIKVSDNDMYYYINKL
ncbi:sodium channel protein para-like protein, partial [Leptotrombidium deliense]